MSIVSTNIRFNLEKEADRTAWDHLQQRNKREHRSYSKAVIAAVNDYFDRRGRLEADPYLETIRAGLIQGTPINETDMLFRRLQDIQPQPAQVDEIALEEQQEADDMALDFVDGF